MAYVLGYFAADGSMLQNKRGGHFIEFTTTDKILLDNLQKVIGSNHHISERPVRNSNWGQQYRLQIGSKAWFQDLKGFGFTTRKSNILRMPSIPEMHVGAFVRGYFDGDGCVYFNKVQFAGRGEPRWVLMTLFTSGSKPYLEELWKVLRARGIQGGYLRTKERGFDLQFSYRDSLALYTLMYNTGEVSDLFLPRKRQKFEKAIQVFGLNKELRS